MEKREQHLAEEKANAITHGAGILFCLVGMYFLLNKPQLEPFSKPFWAAAIFGLGMLMVYGFSTLYHAVQAKKLKKKLQIADHISIYFLIAGTYTPLLVKFLEPNQSQLFLAIMWGMVLLGTIFKIFFTNQFKGLSLLLYLGMGWMILFILEPLQKNVPQAYINWIIAGGAFYTIGVIFYVLSRKPYFHAIWHLFVLAGTICHFVFVYQIS